MGVRPAATSFPASLDPGVAMTMVTLRVAWGLCLALGASLTGLGIELHLDGAGAVTSWPLVVGGILLLPLGSAAIERLGGMTGHPGR